MPDEVKQTLRERAIAACEDDPFIDDCRLQGTTQQSARIEHYADAILALLTPDEEMIERAARTIVERVIRERRRHDTDPATLKEFLPAWVDTHWREWIPEARTALTAALCPKEGDDG